MYAWRGLQPRSVALAFLHIREALREALFPAPHVVPEERTERQAANPADGSRRGKPGSA